MNQPTFIYLPIFNDNPDNPARCEVKTGRIEINRFMWNLLPDYQREYVLAHEKGHYYRQSFDEVEADRYALEQLKYKKPYSLWNYIKSVRAISHNDPQRCYAAEKGALEAAAAKGSAEARELLKTHYSFANADGQRKSTVELPLNIDITSMQAALLIAVVVFLSVVVSTIK